HVQRQDRGGRSRTLGPVDAEASRMHPSRYASAMQQRIFERMNHVDMERIPFNIGTAILGQKLLAPLVTSRVPAHSVAAELLVDIPERELADAPNATRG